jgi:hypothetical protein
VALPSAWATLRTPGARRSVPSVCQLSKASLRVSATVLQTAAPVLALSRATSKASEGPDALPRKLLPVSVKLSRRSPGLTMKPCAKWVWRVGDSRSVAFAPLTCTAPSATQPVVASGPKSPLVKVVFTAAA